MTVLVDADACPVVRIVEKFAKEYADRVILLCDTNHVLDSAYSTIQVVGAGKDAVDLALINACQRGDVVVTQDYGIAALALGKGAHAIHQSGKWYTDENIDGLLMERHLAHKARQSGKHHLKGPKKGQMRMTKGLRKVFVFVLFRILGKYVDFTDNSYYN